MHANLRLGFLILCCSLWASSEVSSNLLKLAVERGLPPEESYFLHRAEDMLDRVKRQQYLTDSQDLYDADRVSQPAECGINSKSKGLVQTLDQAPANEWPWIAMFMNRKELPPTFCGGVLLNRNYVLTAAHCLDSKIAENIYVRLGEYDLDLDNDTRYNDYNVMEMKIHKDYSKVNYQHDIALVKLSETVAYSDFVRPICLPLDNVVVQTNQTAMVAGWGQIFYGGVFSDVLLEVSVPIWDLDNCISKYAPPIFETNICAAGYEGQRDACLGDSGGPLMIQQPNGRWTNIGVVSWGMSCGVRSRPGVYTRVESYLDWIRNNTRDAIL